ncbi:hypothetical protein BDV96DRAFT_202657 [Lophiotrema nucula]|uniref:Extracellular membrane protein CFEM domain-containing protein n=1 Tax=Lophiotrema nucula TaxID=690887 RepID=A0A6A5YTM4_9PLEO|nr:hypothetical protein BDV96DRAFT_202657 [Lophiotrema nucula]
MKKFTYCCRLLSFYSILVPFVHLRPTQAQIGTITQDVTTAAAFGLQKQCARDCFVTTGFCPNDILGSDIGCASHTDCNGRWQATNDCYCRSDLQGPAQAFLTSCIERECSVGDSRIDASSAGSIYAQYCLEKGYSPEAKPATVPATTTKGTGAQTQTAAGGFAAGPTASTTNDNSNSSSSSKLSISTIIGIVVGSLAGLAFLAVALKILFNCLSKTRNKKQVYTPPPQTPYYTQQPVYSAQPHNGLPYYSQPSPMTEEVGPDDSVSMVGGPARPAPTLVSAAGYPRRY